MLATARRGSRLQIPDGVVVDVETRPARIARAALDAGHGADAAALAGRSATPARLPFLPDHEGDWVDGIPRELESIPACVMATTTAPVGVTTGERHSPALVHRKGQVVRGSIVRIARTGGAVDRWFRAGQLGAGSATELARWSGDRR